MLHAICFLNCYSLSIALLCICSITSRNGRDIHAAREKDTSDVEFLDEDPKVTKALWLLHQLLLLQAIYTEQNDGHVPANVVVTGDASSTPRYLFS